jgi:hypothetical protein
MGAMGRWVADLVGAAVWGRAVRYYGIPQRKRWRKKVCGQRPENVHDHQQRDFTQATQHPLDDAGDRHYVCALRKSWLYLCVVIDRTAPQSSRFSLAELVIDPEGGGKQKHRPGLVRCRQRQRHHQQQCSNTQAYLYRQHEQ